MEGKAEGMSDKHHIIMIDGRKVFKSDKYPDLPPGKIILSFNDPLARIALRVYGEYCQDKSLGADILEVLDDMEADNDN